MPDSSHPTTVSFRNAALGQLLSVTVSPGNAEIFEWFGSYIIGSDGRYRLVKNNYCNSISPGNCSIRFLGAPSLEFEDIGSTGTLEVSMGGHGFTYEAILETWEVEAEVGELIRGSARFRLTGV